MHSTLHGDMFQLVQLVDIITETACLHSAEIQWLDKIAKNDQKFVYGNIYLNIGKYWVIWQSG